MPKSSTAGFDNASLAVRLIRGTKLYMKGLFAAAKIRRRRNRAIHHLRGLDSHLLKDIGIDRSEITSIVHGDGHQRRRFEVD